MGFNREVSEHYSASKPLSNRLKTGKKTYISAQGQKFLDLSTPRTKVKASLLSLSAMKTKINAF